MSGTLTVVTLSGTLHQPSKTGIVIDTITAELGRRAPIEITAIDLLGLAPELVAALAGTIPGMLADAFAQVVAADLVVVGTPVYKGSYTGLLKFFIDFLSPESLSGVPVLLSAVGGNDTHALMIDHELRPLFGFFGAHTLPRGVFARGRDFADGRLSDDLSGAIAAALDAAMPVLATRKSG